jgi:hypothetical protein
MHELVFSSFHKTARICQINYVIYTNTIYLQIFAQGAPKYNIGQNRWQKLIFYVLYVEVNG